MLIGILIVVILAAAGVAYFALKGGSHGLMEAVAAIDASSGIAPRDQDSSLLRRLVDERRSNALSTLLIEAGWYDVTPLQLMARSLGYGAATAGAGLVCLIALHRFSPLFLIVVLMAAAYAAYYPHAGMHRAITARKRDVGRGLPDFLDMLCTTVEAGVSLNAALITTSDGLKGALGDELRAAMQDIRLGRSRADALTALAQRVHDADLTSVMTSLVQAERLGSSVTQVLMQLSEESRERRMLRAEELAAQLPNKLVFPLGLCMMPALMLLIFGSVFAKLGR